MNIDAISVGANPPHEVNVIIEVPIGGEPIKYELDKTAGTLVVDRFLHTAMRYPGNYGFIPHTLSEDGDPCDVIITNTRAIVPGAVMAVRPVGVLLMEDEAGGDEKIIAVPVPRLTKRYDRVKTYSDLPEITLEQIQHFFEHYKDLEPGKWVKIVRWGNAEEAQKLILEGIARAKNEKKYEKILRSLRSDRRLRQGVDRAGRAHGVDQQARHRHLAAAARHRRHRARHLHRLIISNVADKTALAAVTRQAIDADIDHGCAGLDPVALHHFRPPHRRKYEISLTTQRRQVARARMRDRHRGVFEEQQLDQRTTDQIRAAEHDSIHALKRRMHGLRQNDAAERCARRQRRQPAREPPRIAGMQPIHVLRRLDRVDDGVGVQPLRQRQLHQNAVDARIAVEPVDHRQHLGLRRIGRKLVLERRHARGQRLLGLAADIDFARRI